MKLYYVNQYAITPDTFGGSRHFELSKSMQPHDVDAEVVAADLSLGAREYLRREAKDRHPIAETFDGVPFHWIYASRYRVNDWRRATSMLEFSWNAYHYMCQLPRPDVIIGSSPHLFAALAAQRAAARHDVPFILEIRDIWPQTLVDMTGTVGATARGLERVAQFLYRRADHLITLARGTDRFLQELGYPTSKITYVPNGVDVDRFPEVSEAERKSLRERFSLPRGGRLFVYAGAHGRANGLDVALDTAALLRDEPDFGIVLVGDGIEKDRLVRRAETEGLNNVYFLPAVPKTEIPTLLATMDAGLLLLKDVEVFRYGISPNKLFDYWAASLPTIATTPGEIGELIARADAGRVVPPEDPTALAGAIKHYLADVNERKREGAAGRAFVEEHFSRHKLAAVLAELVHSVSTSAAR